MWFLSFSGDRVIDVGSEWRTFTNEKATNDPSRVGDAQNPLLNGGDLTTMISKVRNLSAYLMTLHLEGLEHNCMFSSWFLFLYIYIFHLIFQGTGAASFDEFGNSKYQNRRTMSSADRAMLNAFKEITTMSDRINLPRNIIVSVPAYCYWIRW